MHYSDKFQALCDTAIARVTGVNPAAVDELMQNGAVALDIRDIDEHERDHIAHSVHLSRGKLEMLIERTLPDLTTPILCYCNAVNRGALSAASLQDMGYVNACYIDGGLKAYRALAQRSI